MTHIHEKIDFTASVYIVRDDKVLLHVHKKTGHWLPPGGHIELDEDPKQAALREAKEVSGLDIELIATESIPITSSELERELIAPRYLNRHFFGNSVVSGHEHVDMVYFARVVSGELIGEEGGEKMEWFSEADLQEKESELLPRIAWYARKALASLKN